MESQQVTVEAARRRFHSPERYLRNDALIDVRAELVREVLGTVRGRVVDLGCGDGRISLQFHEASEVTLVDLSPNMIARATARIPPQLHGRVRTHVASLYDFTADAPFDVVLCVGVLAHLPDLTNAFAHLSHLLAPSGRLVVQITDFDQFVSHGYMMLTRVKRAVFDRSGYVHHQLRKREVEAAARSAGLELVSERPHWAMPPLTGYVPALVCLQLLRYAARSPRLVAVGSEKLLIFRKA